MYMHTCSKYCIKAIWLSFTSSSLRVLGVYIHMVTPHWIHNDFKDTGLGLYTQARWSTHLRLYLWNEAAIVCTLQQTCDYDTVMYSNTQLNIGWSIHAKTETGLDIIQVLFYSNYNFGHEYLQFRLIIVQVIQYISSYNPSIPFLYLFFFFLLFYCIITISTHSYLIAYKILLTYKG